MEEHITPEMAAARALNAQKKVRVRIPLHPLNEDDRVVPVSVNGYNFFIRRGEWVEVPETVAELLANADYI